MSICLFIKPLFVERKLNSAENRIFKHGGHTHFNPNRAEIFSHLIHGKTAKNCFSY